MKLLKNIFISSIIILAIGCDSLIMKDDKYIETYDDDLIMQIQNATNKNEIEYNDLPINVISTIENSYSTQTFFSELSVSGLGYELTHSDIDTDESSFKKIYFNLKGRKLISKKDYKKRDKECFELVYPISFIMPDESNITVSNREDWEAIKDWYDESPDLEERPTLQYPVDIIYQDGNTITINSDDEMTETKSSCIDCMKLVHPVTFILPDETTITIQNNNEEGWEELKNWYKGNPNIEFDWNLQYPVHVQLKDGTTTTVNSLSEIETIKQGCN